MRSANRSRRQALPWLASAVVTLVACGGSSSPSEPANEEPGAEEIPMLASVKGDTIWAVDLSGRLLMYGTGSLDSLSRISRIDGVALLYRLVGMDVRPSTGEFYGVGNDSRVYKVDARRSTATAVRSTQFEPHIASFFDIHFGMTFDPATDKIRLVAAESRAQWIIDPDNGTATIGASAHYADDDVNAGKIPAISGLAYGPALPALAALRARGVSARSSHLVCERLLYALDAGLDQFAAVCDGDQMDLSSLFEIPAITACSELSVDREGNIFAMAVDAAEQVNKWGYVDSDGIPHWGEKPVPADDAIQNVVIENPDGGSQVGRPSLARWLDARSRPAGLGPELGPVRGTGPAAIAGAGERCTVL